MENSEEKAQVCEPAIPSTGITVVEDKVDDEDMSNYAFVIQKLLAAIFKKAKLNKSDQDEALGKLEYELTGRPFKVAIIGQSGVGKSSTLNAIFGLKLPVSDIAEGTTEIIEKVFPMRDGFNLSIYDMPGLLQNRGRDKVYEEMYREILPQCDVIVYVIRANARNIGDDCKILKEVVLPICNAEGIKDNVIIAVNKVDIIGESIDPDDPDLQWDEFENQPTDKLLECINKKRIDIYDKLITEGLVLLSEYAKTTFTPEQVVFYSANYEYNLGQLLLAITNAGKRGWIWAATVGLDKFLKK